MADVKGVRTRQLRDWVRTAWTRAVAQLRSERSEQLVAGDASGYSVDLADLGNRVSHAARQSVATDIDHGEDVSLAELLDHAEVRPHGGH